MKILALILIIPSIVNAKLVRPSYETARAVGMGNAVLALVNDSNALWYNPAALARVKGIHFNFLDFMYGADSTDTSSRVLSALFKGDYNNILRQDQEHIRFSLRPTLITPYFGFALYHNVNLFTDIGNFNLPNIDIYGVNDLGLLIGFGLPMGDYMSVGFSIKGLQRTGIDFYSSIPELLSVLGTDLAGFQDAIYRHLQRSAGVGFGLGFNAGFLLKVPLATKSPEWRMAFTAEDIGDTRFTGIGGNSAPPAISASYNIGQALIYDLGKNTQFKVAIDMRHVAEFLNRSLPLAKTLHIGAELERKMIALRVGAYQGYLSGGLSLRLLPHTHVHLATYAVELGETLWDRSQRWYLMEINIGFDPI